MSEPTVYYKKVGRKYVPVAQYDDQFMNGFSYGHHLVSCAPSRTSKMMNIDPNYAAVIAATYVSEDEIHAFISEKRKITPTKQPLTQEQVSAWKKFNETMGNDVYITYPSNAEIVYAARRAIESEAMKLLQNPAVKKAWEHFQLVAKLVHDENNS